MLVGVHVVMGVLVRMNMVMFLLLLIIAMVVRGDLIMCMAMRVPSTWTCACELWASASCSYAGAAAVILAWAVFCTS